MTKYDVSKLKTVVECSTVMERAKKQGLTDVFKAVFQRQCELAGKICDDRSDPMVKDFYETLGAYEQLPIEKNGRETAASRNRQKLDIKGVHQSLIEWTRGKTETNGFKLLVEEGLPQYTGEYAEIAKALGQIAPRYTRAIPIQHRLDKRPIVLGSHADGVFAPGKKIPDAHPLIIAQRMTTHHRSAPPIRPTTYESRKANPGNLEGYVRINPSIDDRP